MKGKKILLIGMLLAGLAASGFAAYQVSNGNADAACCVPGCCGGAATTCCQ